MKQTEIRALGTHCGCSLSEPLSAEFFLSIGSAAMCRGGADEKLGEYDLCQVCDPMEHIVSHKSCYSVVDQRCGVEPSTGKAI